MAWITIFEISYQDLFSKYFSKFLRIQNNFSGKLMKIHIHFTCFLCFFLGNQDNVKTLNNFSAKNFFFYTICPVGKHLPPTAQTCQSNGKGEMLHLSKNRWPLATFRSNDLMEWLGRQIPHVLIPVHYFLTGLLNQFYHSRIGYKTGPFKFIFNVQVLSFSSTTGLKL